MKVRVLGCGTSSGVPRIGNDWGDCDPNEPKNRRRRVSILIEADDRRVLVDTSPDLREQLLDADVGRIDTVLWTHDHADHCHGLDDLRQLYHALGRPVDGYARAGTLASIKSRFGYAFDGKGGYPRSVQGRLLGESLELGALKVTTCDQPHGPVTSTGFRFDCDGKSVAYSTDFHILTEEMTTLFKGVDLWIVDALRRRPHPTHPHLGLTLEYIRRVKPKRAVLTHMDNSMDYATLCTELPPGVEPGYDGLEITL